MTNKIKTIVIASILMLSIGGAAFFNGCVTNPETGKKEVDPVTFEIAKGALRAMAYEYTSGEDVIPYVEDFELITSAIDRFLKENPSPEKIVKFIEEFDVEALDSGYARIAMTTLANVYVQYYHEQVMANVPSMAKELIMAANEGFMAGLMDNPDL